MKILSVVNQKGGVGKTTTSINLSACLYKMKRRVLLVDLDPQSNATRGSGIDASMIQNSINDVLLDRVHIEKAIIKSQFDGYDILPATPSLTESEVVLVTRDEREFILKNKLTSILSRYDYVLMDCPPSLNILTVNSLVSATGVLIPVQCEFYALQGLSELINTINQIQNTSNQKLKIEGKISTLYLRPCRLLSVRHLAILTLPSDGKLAILTLCPGPIKMPIYLLLKGQIFGLR